MSKILPFLVAALFFAWMTESSTRGKYGVHRQSAANYIPYILLILTLTMPVAMRRTFNDTGTYIRNFYAAKPLSVLLNSGTLHLLRNPLFQIYQALIRSFTSNESVFFTISALFVQYSYVRFIRRHSPSLLMGIGLYLFLGTYVFSLAAMKQTIAMAVLLYAVEALMERRNRRFYLLVFVAMLFHTYSLMFVILPLFTVKPWSARTFLLLAGILFIMDNFNTVLEGFIELANESGKNVSSEEIIGTASINPIRVAVYAVPSVFALVFRRYIFVGEGDREHNILVNMAFLTVAIMSVGLVNAANMFARMGQYFEFGIICSLPWMISKPFEKSSERLISMIAIVCFAGFFCYANLVQIYFDDHYGRYTLMQYLVCIWQSLSLG